MASSNMSVLDNEMIDDSLFASVGIEPLETSSILAEQEFMELQAEHPSKNVKSINSLETSLDYLLEDCNDTMGEDNLLIENTKTSSQTPKENVLEPNKSPDKSDVLSRVTSIAFGDDCEEDVYIPSIDNDAIIDAMDNRNFSIPTITLAPANSSPMQDYSSSSSYQRSRTSSPKDQSNDAINSQIINDREIKVSSSVSSSPTGYKESRSYQNISKDPKERSFQNVEKSFIRYANQSDPMVFVPLSALRMIASNGFIGDSHARTNDELKFAMKSESLICTKEPRHSPEEEKSSEQSSDDSKEIHKQHKYQSKNFDETEKRRNVPHQHRFRLSEQAVKCNEYLEANDKKIATSSENDDDECVSYDKVNLHDTEDCCKVCGEQAGQHVYYGAKSCQSCRAFFRRSVEAFTRKSGFSYRCKCAEGCFENNAITCLSNRRTRTHCKYCRYIKCQSAGMIKEWVMSAYSPRVDKEKNLHTTRKREIKSVENEYFKRSKCISTAPKDTKILDIIEEMESNYATLNCIENKLIYDVRKAVHSSEKSISSELQTSLDISLAQQTLQHTMNFDEFSELKSDIRMLLLKKNTKSLTKLTMSKFAFDFLLRKGEENKNIAILYQIFRLEYLKDSPKSDVNDQSERDAKKLATKLSKIFSLDKKIVLCLFPIMLFQSCGEENTRKEYISMHEIKYQKFLQRYILYINDNDHFKTDMILDLVNDIIDEFNRV